MLIKLYKQEKNTPCMRRGKSCLYCHGDDKYDCSIKLKEYRNNLSKRLRQSSCIVENYLWNSKRIITIMPLFKIWNTSRTSKKFVMADNLESLIENGNYIYRFKA